jgi:hypothetical protein
MKKEKLTEQEYLERIDEIIKAHGGCIPEAIVDMIVFSTTVIIINNKKYVKEKAKNKSVRNRSKSKSR